MSGVEVNAPGSAEKPFVTVSYDAEGKETIATNLPPGQRPVVLWMLRRAEQMILTQPSEQEKASLVKPHGMNGLLKRMGKG